jgi:hypothetical protein
MINNTSENNQLDAKVSCISYWFHIWFISSFLKDRERLHTIGQASTSEFQEKKKQIPKLNFNGSSNFKAIVKQKGKKATCYYQFEVDRFFGEYDEIKNIQR